MTCKLCDKPLDKCSNPTLHEGKLKIAELLRELRVCEQSKNKPIIKQIQALENQYNVPKLEQYNFTTDIAKEKFNLKEDDV